MKYPAGLEEKLRERDPDLIAITHCHGAFIGSFKSSFGIQAGKLAGEG